MQQGTLIVSVCVAGGGGEFGYKRGPSHGLGTEAQGQRGNTPPPPAQREWDAAASPRRSKQAEAHRNGLRLHLNLKCKSGKAGNPCSSPTVRQALHCAKLPPHTSRERVAEDGGATVCNQLLAILRKQATFGPLLIKGPISMSICEHGEAGPQLSTLSATSRPGLLHVDTAGVLQAKCFFQVVRRTAPNWQFHVCGVHGPQRAMF